MRSTEFDMLKNFKRCLNIKNRITQDWNGRLHCYRVQFGNVQFYRWLQRIGLSPAKSKTIKGIEIPDKYFRDFIRGHFDGDGSIQVYRDNYISYKGRTYNNLRLCIRLISASKHHILWLRNKIFQLQSIGCALIKKQSPDNHKTTIWELKFSKHNSVKLLNWMFYENNLPSLRRKYMLARKTLRVIMRERRKQYEFISKR